MPAKGHIRPLAPLAPLPTFHPKQAASKIPLLRTRKRVKACRQSAALSVAKRQKVQVAKGSGIPGYGHGQLEPEGGEQLAGPGAKKSRNRRFDCNWDFPELPISKDLIGKPKGVKRVPQERGLWRDALKRQCNRQKKDSCSGKKQETGSWALRLVSMFLKRLWIAEVLHPSHSATTRRSNSEQEMMTHSTIAIR